jgi:hypothetical protein
MVEKVKFLLGIKMAVTGRGGGKVGIKKQGDPRKGDIEKIKLEGKRDKEQEITIRHEAVPPKKVTSVWSWHEEFVAEWTESLISKKRKKIQKDEKETREK